MTLLGKIFTVLIFIMSVLFMAFAVMTFATHRNWRDAAEKLKKQVEEGVIANQQFEAQKRVLEAQIAFEQAARRAALATLQGKIAKYELDLETNKKNLEKTTSSLTEATQAAKLAEEQLTAATAELVAARSDLQVAMNDRDDQFKKAVEFYDKNNQAKNQLEILQERNESLQAQYSSLVRIADAAGIGPETEVYAKPPPIDARITKVKEASGLVEISIGSDDGIKTGHTMEVYRGKDYLGSITIRETESDRAVGEINKKLQRARIVEGDHVTTKLS